MLNIDAAVSSTVSFETDGTLAWPKMLHKIAHDIELDGLKIQRIAMFEQPLLARVYLKDVTFRSARRRRFLDVIKPKPHPDAYDYVMCIELEERPYFQGACSYKIERSVYFDNIKTSKRRPLSERFEHVRHSLSNNILKSLINTVGRDFGVCKRV